MNDLAKRLASAILGKPYPHSALRDIHYICTGCEQSAFQVSENAKNGIESISCCNLCGCSIQSHNYGKLKPSEDDKMLAKLDNGNAVLFSEISAISFSNKEEHQVVISTKSGHRVYGDSSFENFDRTDSKKVIKERNRLVGQWKAWLNGGEK